MEPFRDDSPLEFSLDRRRLLANSLVLIGGLASSATAFAVPPTASAPLLVPKFMRVSSLLIEHELNAAVGARLAVAMSSINPTIEHDIDRILEVAKAKTAKIAEDFFPDLPEGGTRATALAIISAWYSGVLVDAVGSMVFAYELALMYQPTRDVMTIPSYAISAPNGWNSSAPPLSAMPAF
jgi:hypothetical protein